MIYIEMSRDMTHGGGSWAFPNCVWAPTKTRSGRLSAYWSKILQIREGDTIIHLRGKPPQANFVGYSVASGNGFETIRRPPNPKAWSYAQSFYRADLAEYTPFHEPVNLTRLFASRRDKLEAYFDANKTKKGRKLNLFFVRQAGRLQCQNGAYLSDVDNELLTILFGSGNAIVFENKIVVSVQTSEQIATVRQRQGQANFSAEIKRLYGNSCCFPGCKISDPRFLIGAHIARWSDNEELRGHMGNGLCLCLIHDKAFEIGLFTLDEQFRVFVNPREIASDSSIVQGLIKCHGEQITLADVKPLDDALLEHWIRVGIEP